MCLAMVRMYECRLPRLVKAIYTSRFVLLSVWNERDIVSVIVVY